MRNDRTPTNSENASTFKEAVTIRDLRGGTLAFDLIDVLRLSASDIENSSWRCTVEECTGEAAAELYSIGENHCTVPGNELLRLAAQIQQVIDGEFKAYRSGEPRPWLVIKAVDSSYYVVATTNAAFISAVRGKFRDVRNSLEDLALLEG